MNATTSCAQDAFATLCVLYGDALVAQTLMRVRGSCCPRVARLAKKVLGSQVAVKAAKEYRKLGSLRPGYLRLITAAGGNRAVKALVASAAMGREFSPWEIDTAVRVALAVNEREL